MSAQPQCGDYSTYGGDWREHIEMVATTLRKLGEDVALEILRETALYLGEWTPELQAIGLRILKPDTPWAELVSA